MTAALRPGDLIGRALRRLLLGRHQPGARRHQRRERRLRPRPPDGHDRAGQRQLGGAQGNDGSVRPGDLGGRALRRLPVGGHQPGAGRHQQRARHLCPRPPDGHDRAGQRQLKRRPGQWLQLRPGDLGGWALRRLHSLATNLVPGDTNIAYDVFVHDRQTGKTRRVSVSSGGVLGNDQSAGPAISADGRFVAFDSVATNLVPGDTNGMADVFVRILAP